MIVRDFLHWAQQAPAAQRAQGAARLAEACLYSDLDGPTRRDAELALFSLLEDPSPLVRRALAETLASASDAPRALVAALAGDQSDVAAPVLSQSPLLSDGELIDCAAVGDSVSQTAIAQRPHVPPGVAAALAEIGGREAAAALARNPGAEVAEFSLRRLVERFGDDGEIREALLSRPSLPPAIRSALVDAAAAALSAFAIDCGWLSPEKGARLTRESRERANLLIAADLADDSHDGLRDLAAHLRDADRLTPGFLLRAVLSGRRDLFGAALVELSGLRAERVAAMLSDFRSSGFAALYARAGLPEKFLPAFRAALAARTDIAPGAANDLRLSRQAVRHTLDVCESVNDGALDRLVALLRRLEVEAAMEEARALQAIPPAPKLLPPPPLIDLDLLETDISLAA